jgi:hypothetical protein
MMMTTMTMAMMVMLVPGNTLSIVIAKLQQKAIKFSIYFYCLFCAFPPCTHSPRARGHAKKFIGARKFRVQNEIVAKLEQ